MTFTEKLDYLMKKHGLTRGSLAKATGIPYTTIVGFYERDSDSIRLSNIKKLAKWFGVSVEYLCDDSHYQTMKQLPYIPPIHLGQSELFSLKNRMMQLNIIPSSEYQKIRTNLRRILFEVITLHFLPSISPNHDTIQCPSWLSQALTRWNSDEHRSEGLDFFCNMTGYSKEHICRTFKRCLGLTPTAYLNEQRLNYAVNLLLHTDYSITDISYESGFTSPSRFYQLFHKTYGVSPKNFLQQRSDNAQNLL